MIFLFSNRKYRKRRNNVNAHRISKTTIEGYSTPDGRSAYCVETSNEGYVPTKFRRVTSIYNESEIEISDSNADICNKTATNNGSTSEPRVNTRYSRQARLISKPIEKTLSNDHSAHKTVALPVMSAEQLVWGMFDPTTNHPIPMEIMDVRHIAARRNAHDISLSEKLYTSCKNLLNLSAEANAIWIYKDFTRVQFFTLHRAQVNPHSPTSFVKNFFLLADIRFRPSIFCLPIFHTAVFYDVGNLLVEDVFFQ